MNRTLRKLRASLLGLGLLACSGLTGCGGGGHSVYPVRMGALYDAKPATCPIAFENMPGDEAMQKYEVLGMLTVSGAKSLTPEVKQDVVAEACAMGADVVTFGAGHGDSMVFQAYRNR
jgi:hypothetical protein